MSLQENVASLVENVIEDIGFSHGIPVVGLTIYKCLLNQKHLEAETTIVFDRLIQIIVSTIWVFPSAMIKKIKHYLDVKLI